MAGSRRGARSPTGQCSRTELETELASSMTLRRQSKSLAFGSASKKKQPTGW
jgi:hypothetical protein